MRQREAASQRGSINSGTLSLNLSRLPGAIWTLTDRFEGHGSVGVCGFRQHRVDIRTQIFTIAACVLVRTRG
jgi:hypothetical protein